MMNKKSLLKTAFAKKVREAMKSGELRRWNIGEWVAEYNSGLWDKGLHQEVEFLINHYEGERDYVLQGVYED